MSRAYRVGIPCRSWDAGAIRTRAAIGGRGGAAWVGRSGAREALGYSLCSRKSDGVYAATYATQTGFWGCGENVPAENDLAAVEAAL